jgi:hypothetical protein
VRGPSSAGRLVLSVASALVASTTRDGETPEDLASDEAVRALLRTRKELL